jgi:hypothetical protein
MAGARNGSKRNRGKRAAPALGIAGVSLATAGGASAPSAGSAVDVPVQNATIHHDLLLGEEEISDVSLLRFRQGERRNASRRRISLKADDKLGSDKPKGKTR